MRKGLFIIILAIAVLLPGAVLSSGVYYQDSNDILYIGANNSLFVPGESEAVLADRVRGIVAVADELVYYIAGDPEASDDSQAILYAYEYTSGADDAEPRQIAVLSGDAVWSADDEMIYYASSSDPSTLMAFDPATEDETQATQADGDILGLRICADGLLVKTASGESLYVPRLNSLVAPSQDTVGVDFTAFEGGELVLDADNALSIKLRNDDEQKPIDTDVNFAVVEANNVYYIKLTDGVSSLLSYDIASGEVKTLDMYEEVMLNDLTADGDYVYLVGQSGIIYQYSISGEKSILFAGIDTEQVKQPYLVALSNLLLIYDYAATSDNRFVKKLDLNNYTPPSDELAKQFAPAEKEVIVALSKGSRGDDVVKLQTALKDLGYLSGSADGIFGNNTLEAVILAQEDNNLPQTGTADERFLDELYSGGIEPYVRYKGLNPGDSGTRVTQLQERLRALYYMKAPADGEYGSNTTDAVARFQSQMGYNDSGRISASQVEKLFSSKAEKYDSYLPLQSGDNAPAVKRLATRLKKLGYMTHSATNSYNKYVIRAVKLFESYNGLRETGKASVKRQQSIYSSRAKHYEPDPTPTPKPKYITDKQLKKMRNWMNKNLGKNYSKPQAIGKLQEKLIDLGFMGGGTTRKYDEATYNCVKEFQRAKGLKANGVANVETLKKMFVYG